MHRAELKFILINSRVYVIQTRLKFVERERISCLFDETDVYVLRMKFIE